MGIFPFFFNKFINLLDNSLRLIKKKHEQLKCNVRYQEDVGGIDVYK